MNRVFASIAASAALLGLAACADSVTDVGAPLTLRPSLSRYPELNDSHGHIMKVKSEGKKDVDQSEKDARDAKVNSSKIAGTGIYYHGGPVLQSGTNVASIYWAGSTIYNNGPTPGVSGPGSADGSLIGFFLSHLGGSPYYNINHSYKDGSNAAIANSVTYTQFWANNDGTPPSGSQSVSDAQMVAMLQSAFDQRKLTYDDHTLYAIFTAGKVNLGGGFGTQYCAYHTHGTVTIGGVAKNVLYAAMPYDQAYPGVCTEGTAPPNGATEAGADAEVNTLAHETEETTTDMMANAWYDRRGYENADKCAWTWGTTYVNANGGTANMNLAGKDFLVQQNWVNAGSGGCRMSW